MLPTPAPASRDDVLRGSRQIAGIDTPHCPIQRSRVGASPAKGRRMEAAAAMKTGAQ